MKRLSCVCVTSMLLNCRGHIFLEVKDEIIQQTVMAQDNSLTYNLHVPVFHVKSNQEVYVFCVWEESIASGRCIP